LPKLFRVGPYTIFFWSNENDEPIHVHAAIGVPYANSTKIWITKNGGCIISHNKGRIPQSDLNELMNTINDNFFYICSEWKRFFSIDSIRFYC
jgi:hypothetical protein